MPTEDTTIRVTRETWEALKTLKTDTDESFDDVLQDLLDDSDYQ